jgi:hypothetical protein
MGSENKRRLTRRRRGHTIEVGREKSILEVGGKGGEIRALHPGGLTCDHFVALEDINAGGDEGGAGRVKDVRAHVVTIRPYAGVRVIDEIRSVREEIVEIPGAGRVTGLRDREALVRETPGASIDHKLRHYPAIGKNVIGHDRVSIVVRGANASERLEEGVASGRTVEQRPRIFIENRKAGVVPLHVLGGPDATVHIGRIASRGEPAESYADGVPAHAGRRWRRVDRAQGRLESSVNAGAFRWSRRNHRFHVVMTGCQRWWDHPHSAQWAGEHWLHPFENLWGSSAGWRASTRGLRGYAEAGQCEDGEGQADAAQREAKK